MRISCLAFKVSRFLLVLLLVAGSVALVGSSKSPYTPHDKAYYLSPELVNFVRPGLNITINSAQIASGGTITMTYTITDPMGLPLDAAGVTTPGPVSLAYVAAYLPKGQEQYVALTTAQSTGSVSGTVTVPDWEFGAPPKQVGPGQYQYTFRATAPSGYDPTTTFTVAADGNRDLTAFDMGTSYAGSTFNFTPGGAAVTITRDVIRTQSCNRCHDQLAFHGGYAHGMEMCVLCHQPQNIDPNTGNLLDLKVMAHKIHMGSQLPSVIAGTPYQIIGYMGSVNDFSTVVLPSNPQRCEVCHDQTTKAAQATAFMTNPTRAACGACHDDVNFATGANHPGGFQADDTQCANCHQPKGETPFDASILGAHVVATDTTATYPQNPDTLLAGLNLAITGITNTSAGKAPTVAFTVKDNSGNNIPLSQLGSISFTMAGPTTDYGYTVFGTATTPGYVTESATKATCDSNGNCSYTFTNTVPAGATGTYAIAGESRMNQTVLSGTTSQQSVQIGAANPVAYFSVDGSPVQSRRTVVQIGNCNQCHVALSLHGSNRNQTEYCVFCHNPSNTDVSQRGNAQDPTDKTQPPQGINFALMVHRIHSGVNVVAEGGKPYIVVGYKGSHNDFSDVLFPGMNLTGEATYLGNCAFCHANDSQQTLPTGLNMVSDPQGWINPTVGPTASACSGCHAGKPASSHFLANSNSLGESCDVCHASGAQFSVDQVHAE